MRVDLQAIDNYVATAKQNALSARNIEKILSLIDLTSLNETDTADSIRALCEKAESEFGSVAAVCVYPRFVTEVIQHLSNPAIKVSAVANFPEGTDSLEKVMEEIHQSIAMGAEEIDVVFPYAQYLAGNKKTAYDFIRACKTVCGKSVLLKVILETGVLNDLSVIAEVSHNVCLAGADFLKTSTGKMPVGATLEAACVMLMTAKELSAKLHRPIGLKVSGGIRSVEQAAQYIELASQITDTFWVIPGHFRIGASQLVDNILAVLRQQDVGADSGVVY